MEIQLNLSTTATLGKEESGRCREVLMKSQCMDFSWFLVPRDEKKWPLTEVELYIKTNLMCLEMLKSQLSFSISFLPYVGLLSIKDDNQVRIILYHPLCCAMYWIKSHNRTLDWILHTLRRHYQNRHTAHITERFIIFTKANTLYVKDLTVDERFNKWKIDLLKTNVLWYSLVANRRSAG